MRGKVILLPTIFDIAAFYLGLFNIFFMLIGTTILIVGFSGRVLSGYYALLVALGMALSSGQTFPGKIIMVVIGAFPILVTVLILQAVKSRRAQLNWKVLKILGTVSVLMYFAFPILLDVLYSINFLDRSSRW